MDPSKPNDPQVDQGQPIPRSRQANDEVLEGEVLDRGIPIGSPRTDSPPGPIPKQRRATRRTILWTLVGIAAFVCLGGLGVGYVYYDNATTPDRRTPGGTLEEYLDSRLNGGAPERLQLLICRSPNLREFDDFVNQLAAKESDSGHKIKVNASTYDFRSTSDDKVEIETDLVMTAGPQNASEYVKQHWQFDLVREDGWRVCGAHRLQ
ncbi:hypothetical protein AB0M46_20685 [Dactylosporangium sp. NPDC051485]|uniref:hypothetical protein n=1 Tax=Dactylosporangium sp. NPDC051485 TaxID=3154846 RepID=UPI00343CC7AD